MSKVETVWRSMHDVGLAAWFGGSLADLVTAGLGATYGPAGAAGGGEQVAPTARERIGQAMLAGMGVHLAGGAGLLVLNRARLAAQRGVATSATGAVVVLGAVEGEQQRPREMGRGVMGRAAGVVGLDRLADAVVDGMAGRLSAARDVIERVI